MDGRSGARRHDTGRAGARRLRPAALVLVALLTACGESGSTAGTPDADLADRVFLSTEARGRTLVPGTQVQVTFSRDSVSVQAGCNTLVGQATWDGGVLAVAAPMASTMMACSEELMSQDEWLAGFFAASPRVRLDGTTLTLGDGSEGLVLAEQ